MTYLTFDCYGTLIDWKTGIERSLAEALGELPLSGRRLLDVYVEEEKKEEGSYKKYRRVLELTALRLAERFGLRAEEKAASKFAASVPSWPAFDDTAGALRELGSRGYKRYILSNVDTDLLEETIKRHGLEVDGYVTAEEAGTYKPDPGHWKLFMKKTGARPDQVVHVAQSIYHDIIPTRALGIESVWVNRYGESLPAEASPTCIADSMDGVVQVVGTSGEGLV